MADKKLTTEEILARLRNQDSGGAAAEEPRPPSAQEPEEAEQTAAGEGVSAAEPAAAPKPAAKPTSTADILAAARGQKGGGAAKPAEGAAKPAAGGAKSAGGGAKPSSTADILAAARAQSGGAAKPAAGGAKPGSTADILAAARAQGGGAAGGGTATGSADRPSGGGGAEPGGSPSRPVAEKGPPAGERPSVAEMVRAAREGRPLEGPPAPAGPRLPSKPPVPKAAKPADDATRRGFLAAAIIGMATPYYLAWTVMALIGGVWSLLVARFMMPNMIVEPPMRFKVGPPSDYPAGTVSEKWKAERGIWIVNTDSYDGRNLIYALASVCTHLGCTPNWLDGEQKYKCPCHGSGFYINGINFEGPAPRPLERVGIRLAEDGSLEVDKSVKFQEELGQWQDPSSYVELV
jgi:cytochrome b6-f complex iron-sulfur subunit